MSEDLKADTKVDRESERQFTRIQAAAIDGYLSEMDGLLKAVLDVAQQGIAEGAVNRHIQAQGRFQVIHEMVELYRERWAGFNRSHYPSRDEMEEYQGGGNS